MKKIRVQIVSKYDGAETYAVLNGDNLAEELFNLAKNMYDYMIIVEGDYVAPAHWIDDLKNIIRNSRRHEDDLLPNEQNHWISVEVVKNRPYGRGSCACMVAVHC